MDQLMDFLGTSQGTIHWAKISGPDDLTCSEDGAITWYVDEKDYSAGIYPVEFLGVDDCGCLFPVSYDINVAADCVECCCGNVPNDSTITVSWNGNLWNLTRTPPGCDIWMFEVGALQVGVRIQLLSEICKMTVNISDSGTTLFYSGDNVISGACCDIDNFEIPDKLNVPPGPSAFITMNC